MLFYKLHKDELHVLILITQHKAVYLLFCKFTIYVSGVNHTHHQEYTKL